MIKSMKTERKPLTAGVLITNGDVFLACRATGHSRYNLPKGMQEEGETPLETCCRECKEETGIVLDPGRLTDLGKFPYLRSKDLHLFMWLTGDMPSLERLHCASLFRHYRTHQMVAEIDDYRYLRFDMMDEWLDKSIARILHRIADEVIVGGI